MAVLCRECWVGRGCWGLPVVFQGGVPAGSRLGVPAEFLAKFGVSLWAALYHQVGKTTTKTLSGESGESGQAAQPNSQNC